MTRGAKSYSRNVGLRLRRSRESYLEKMRSLREMRGDIQIQRRLSQMYKEHRGEMIMINTKDDGRG